MSTEIRYLMHPSLKADSLVSVHYTRVNDLETFRETFLLQSCDLVPDSQFALQPGGQDRAQLPAQAICDPVKGLRPPAKRAMHLLCR